MGARRGAGRRAAAWLVALLRERRRLLGLLRHVGWPAVAVGVFECMAGLVPAAVALATGRLVSEVVDATGRGARFSAAVPWLSLVGVLLVVELVAQTFVQPVRSWTATRVNGAIRRQVRQAVAARSGIDHLEDQTVRDAAALPVHDTYLFNIGAGAEGQLWLLARFVGAFGAAGVVAQRYPLLALWVFSLMAFQRGYMRRYYARNVAGFVGRSTPAMREASYWAEVAGSQLGAKEVRLFGFGSWVLDRYQAAQSRGLLSNSGIGAVSGMGRHVVIFVSNAGAVLVPFIVIARDVQGGAMSAGIAAMVLGGVIAVQRSLGSMGWESYSIAAAVPQLDALARLESLHAAETSRRTPVAASAAGAGATHTAPPTVVFEDVWFRYPGAAHDVLRGTDLTLRPGESVAIVGENGAGKTTLLKLLCGFYEPTRGRVLIDGADLAEIGIQQWRRRLAVIFQDFARFELAAIDNVALAAMDHPARADLARDAAEAAGALELIEGLPHGWDTVLSRRFRKGTDLSGGQWQRVALARALYAARTGGQVLVLDEPTASLDIDAEVRLFDQLLTHAAGLTAIVVSHRFSTVRRAQRIVVLSDGRLAEDGDHRTLHAAGGLYARLYDLQAESFRSATA